MPRAEGLLRIDDLAEPVPTPAHRTALDLAERHPPQLTVSAVLEAARQETALTDFGSLEFLPRLEAYIQEISSDAQRSALGRKRAYELLVNSAIMRLRLQDFVARRPEVEELDVERPIVVVGPWRSGTTFLHRLLASVPQLRAFRAWELMDPVPKVGGEEELQVRRRRERATKALREIDELLPYFRSMHPMSEDSPEEEKSPFYADFAGCVWEWHTSAKHWRKHLLAPGQAGHYRYMLRMLKASQWEGPNKRLVLKAPHHSTNIGPLLEVLPDATIVLTYRDPIQIVSSLALLRAYAARLDYHAVNVNAEIGRCVERLDLTLQAILRDRCLVQPRNLVNVHYQELVQNPAAVLARIYRTAGLETHEDLADRVADVKAKQVGSRSRLANQILDEFGWSEAELRARFSYYYADARC